MLKQAEPQISYHYRKNDRGDAVLQMIERVANTDKPESEPLLLLGGFDGLCANAGGVCGFLNAHNQPSVQAAGVTCQRTPET